MRFVHVVRASVGFLVLFVLALVLATPATAQLTSTQVKCVRTLTKDGGKVSKAESKLAQKCMKDGANGKLAGTTDECIDDDVKGKVASSKSKTFGDELSKCPDGSGFVVTSAVQVNASSQYQTLELLHDLLGPNTDLALQGNIDNKRCQQKVQKALDKLLATKLKSYGKCLKTAAATAVDITPLDACLSALPSDSKVQRAIEKLTDARIKSCAPINLPTIFPGNCAGEILPNDFDACAEALAECRACTVLGGSNGLTVDCDLFDNGVADLSCDVAAPVCGDGNVDPGEDCDPGAEPLCCQSNCTIELDGLACDDGAFCNGPEMCLSGVCTSPGDPCSGGADCNAACNEGTDDCFDAGGSACTDDGNECTDDVCDGAGACAHPGNINPCTDDGNECTDDFCDGGGTCAHPPNFDPCTDDGNVCTDDVCDGAGSCSHPGNTDPCDDANACTTVDVCDGAGTCAGSVPPNCDDSNVCTDDSCDGGSGCLNANNSAPCDDSLFCTGADTCGGGSCSIHAGDPCAGGAQCNVTCNEGPDNCFDSSGTACDFGAPGPNDACDATTDECDGGGACVNLDPTEGPELCYVAGDEDCDGFADNLDPHSDSLCTTTGTEACQCSDACDVRRIVPAAAGSTSLGAFAPWASNSLGSVTVTLAGNANPGVAARTMSYDFSGVPGSLTMWWGLTDGASTGTEPPRGGANNPANYAGVSNITYAAGQTSYQRFSETFNCVSPPPGGCPSANTWSLVMSDNDGANGWDTLPNQFDLFDLQPLAVRTEAVTYLQDAGAVEIGVDPFVVSATQLFGASLIDSVYDPATTNSSVQYGVAFEGALYGTLRNAHVCP